MNKILFKEYVSKVDSNSKIKAFQYDGSYEQDDEILTRMNNNNNFATISEPIDKLVFVDEDEIFIINPGDYIFFELPVDNDYKWDFLPNEDFIEEYSIYIPVVPKEKEKKEIKDSLSDIYSARLYKNGKLVYKYDGDKPPHGKEYEKYEKEFENIKFSDDLDVDGFFSNFMTDFPIKFNKSFPFTF
jgi:hypothetical protein